jgi:hypothetical protein
VGDSATWEKKAAEAQGGIFSSQASLDAMNQKRGHSVNSFFSS